jgi:hypothetical protein
MFLAIMPWPLSLQQGTNLYLAVVHILDKQFGFPFAPKRDPMPTYCLIDKHVEFNREDNEYNNPVVVAGLTTLMPNMWNTLA